MLEAGTGLEPVPGKGPVNLGTAPPPGGGGRIPTLPLPKIYQKDISRQFLIYM